ncbi:hypothetical protein [Flavisolibacter ginsengisoli]|jgi:hypothetical protein|uniref:Uncharacterized protein n=1 Tax=Flavisolibacter ginsengisoli DSM 18119 TaxID=1121884 RepID=A0A1M5CGB8_9BACT|nr:hypothetical protein [Flavisolibacter ginsengisoli]SHF53637.1 hypothetical protein SAMN02745131_02925 [Flavisolibacter ginsengisoli DSM 18119]
MENITEQVIPTKQGQIVVICNPLQDEDPNEQYMIAEDPSPYPPERQILLYSVTQILRSNASGTLPLGTSVQISDLHVVGEDLKTWVEGWNSNPI